MKLHQQLCSSILTVAAHISFGELGCNFKPIFCSLRSIRVLQFVILLTTFAQSNSEGDRLPVGSAISIAVKYLWQQLFVIHRLVRPACACSRGLNQRRKWPPRMSPQVSLMCGHLGCTCTERLQRGTPTRQTQPTDCRTACQCLEETGKE